MSILTTYKKSEDKLMVAVDAVLTRLQELLEQGKLNVEVMGGGANFVMENGELVEVKMSFKE